MNTEKSHKLSGRATILLGLSTLVVGLLPFLPIPEGEQSGFLVFLGRFHPLLLHFPIVLVLMLAGLESWQFFNKKRALPDQWISTLLAITLVSIFITVIGGYFLYRSGDYQGLFIRRHLWGGVLLMLMLNVAAWFRWKASVKNHQQIYRGLLLVAVITTIFTSHIGGSITHGKDFLTEHLPSLRPSKPAAVESKKPQDLIVFQDLIKPALEDHCLSCHNEYKTKGGLLMTSINAIQKGGKSGKPMLVAGQPEKSEFYHRITLPMEDDDHMPPSEKAPLNDDEIALIEWWIQEGADPDRMLGVEIPDSIVSLVDRYLPQLYRSERLKERQRKEHEKLAAELAAFGEKLNLVIEPDPESEEGHFGVSMQIPPAFVDNRTVSKLMPYASIISKLSLPGAEVSDDAFYEISKMPNLKELYLPKTCIKGNGLLHLKSLEALERINLSYSFLSNEGVLNLIQLPGLKEVFVYNTEVDPLVLTTVQNHLKKVKIVEMEGPYY